MWSVPDNKVAVEFRGSGRGASGLLPVPFLKEKPRNSAGSQEATLKERVELSSSGGDGREECGYFPLLDELPVEAAADMVAELEDCRIGNRVIHAVGFLPTAQNSSIRQLTELPGDVGLAGSSSVH